ncbi:Ku protein [Tunturiibacter gelidoferens]|uniref:Non-homologous end joining protein Ku n=1 Tax=Tunturiibacter gelidiferens TaxID=3069689 RepID=A0A9X0U3P5_9BACT|nr:Ku protein [Edaphobacter lichenicola]MBB5328538.1 DNA end-binding protein Ku [Edaphobacter lichenicola]
MPTRPTWSGSIQISLVSISVNIFPATNPGRQVEFHQIDRKTHKRVHHQIIDESGEVEKADIVKGFEYAKDKYIEIDPDELKALRIPTATTMQIKQFVKADEISSALYDRPYFVTPKDEVQAKALSIMRKALAQTDTLGIGEIAFSGREHLVAIAAPLDPKQKGLMLYMLRYDDELRDPKLTLSGVKEASVDADELALAKQLIAKSTSKFDLSAYQNDYESAVKKLVDAKRKGRSLPEPEPVTTKTKVVNIMDALRSSLAKDKPTKATSKVARKKRKVA